MSTTNKHLHIAEQLECNIHAEIKEGIVAQPFFHWHNGYEAFLFLDGDITYYIGKESFCPKPGSLFLIPPNEYHRPVCSEQATCYKRAIIYLLPQYLNSISSASTNLLLCLKKHGPHDSIRIAELTKEQQDIYLDFVRKLEKHQQGNNYGDDLQLQALTIQLVLFINSIYTKDSSATPAMLPRIVTDTIAYVDQHLTEDFSVEQLAKALFHNRSYISRIFHETTGFTLQQYIINKRILLAQSLLKSGESITNSCYKSGFRNYENFIRIFKKNVGISPLHYQKESLKNEISKK